MLTTKACLALTGFTIIQSKLYVKQLLGKNGIYRELYETQFSKTMIEEDGVSELEQYIWGTQPADEPYDEEE